MTPGLPLHLPEDPEALEQNLGAHGAKFENHYLQYINDVIDTGDDDQVLLKLNGRTGRAD